MSRDIVDTCRIILPLNPKVDFTDFSCTEDYPEESVNLAWLDGDRLARQAFANKQLPSPEIDAAVSSYLPHLVTAVVFDGA